MALNVLTSSGTKRLVKADVPTDTLLLDLLVAFSADHPASL